MDLRNCVERVLYQENIDGKEFSPRRKRTLTESDLEALAELMSKHQVCALGIDPDVAKAISALTPEQIGILRRVMSMMGSAANTIGSAIVITIVAIFFAMLTKGFWASIADEIKKIIG